MLYNGNSTVSWFISDKVRTTSVLAQAAKARARPLERLISKKRWTCHPRIFQPGI